MHSEIVILTMKNFVVTPEEVPVRPSLSILIRFRCRAVKYLEDSYNKEEAAHFPILDLPLSNRISSSERLLYIFFTSPFQAVPGKEEQMKESLTLDWLQ
ncbi:hypothetical protein CDAR_483421 [Caerostris darwini]|uniref:Uncharacterized protein n=1 Tax=Caerostris darwini TaxID=1538125 RepID=A0AAV4S6P9_9ARAC|nr:hypothetical protein CDAR_483421 [Caerostris darwini]